MGDEMLYYRSATTAIYHTLNGLVVRVESWGDPDDWCIDLCAPFIDGLEEALDYLGARRICTAPLVAEYTSKSSAQRAARRLVAALEAA